MIKKKLDIIITSFLREENLKDLLKSILRYDIKLAGNITVGVQSKKPIKNLRIRNKEIKCIKQPFDCGLSHARNDLITRTKRPYILLLEDDFLFCNETRIDKMLFLLTQIPSAGVVGGGLKELGQRINFEHKFKRTKDILRQISDGEEYHNYGGLVEYKRTGCVLNFAMFNRKIFGGHYWDKKQKLAEHTDFYIRWPKGWDILFTPDSIIDHIKSDSREYRAYKNRHQIYMKRFMKKHKLKYYIYTDGFTYFWNAKEKRLYQTRENRDGKIL